MVNIDSQTHVAYGYVSANELDDEIVEQLLYGHQAKGDVEGDVEEEIDRYGTLEGVDYKTSWLGGALHFFITYSPYIVKGNRASPCVPNACILNKGECGPVTGFGVPSDWWSNYES